MFLQYNRKCRLLNVYLLLTCVLSNCFSVFIEQICRRDAFIGIYRLHCTGNAVFLVWYKDIPVIYGSNFSLDSGSTMHTGALCNDTGL